MYVVIDIKSMVWSFINFRVKWGGLVAGELQTRLLAERGGGGLGYM